MNLPTINIVETLFKTPQAKLAGGGMTLRAGQEIRGEILGIQADGRARIDFGDFQTLADVRFPVRTGDGLWVRVESTQPRLRFSHIPQPGQLSQPTVPSTGDQNVGAPSAGQPVKIDMGNIFNAARSILAQLQSIAGQGAQKGAPPQTGFGRALDAIAKLVEHFRPLNPDAAGAAKTATHVQRLVEDSGHFLGAKLNQAVQTSTAKAPLGVRGGTNAVQPQTQHPVQNQVQTQVQNQVQGQPPPPQTVLAQLGVLTGRLREFWNQFGSPLLKQMDPAVAGPLQLQTERLMSDLSRAAGMAPKTGGVPQPPADPSAVPGTPSPPLMSAEGLFSAKNPSLGGGQLQAGLAANTNAFGNATTQTSGAATAGMLASGPDLPVTVAKLQQWVQQADTISGQWRDQIETLLVSSKTAHHPQPNAQIAAAQQTIGAVRDSLSQLIDLLNASESDRQAQTGTDATRDMARMAKAIQKDLRTNLAVLDDLLENADRLGIPKGEKGILQMQRMVKELLEDFQHQFRQNTARQTGNDQMHVYTHWIPLQDDTHGATLKLFYAPPKGDHKRTGFKASILLELDRLGALRTDVAVAESSLNVNFYASDASTESLINEHLESLNQDLGKLFETVSMSVRRAPQQVDRFEQQDLMAAGDSLLNVRI